jgi:predicted amidohydrolase YtcJ
LRRSMTLCSALPGVVSLIFAALTAPACGQEVAQPKAADVVVINARIYTVNPQQPWAEALAIAGHKIIAVGSAREITPRRGPDTKVIDVKGRLVLPGFRDCHIHFLDGSLSLLQVNLDEERTIADIQRQVKAYSAAHPNLPWVLGRGWLYTAFVPSGLPHKKYLDQIVPDRPVYLESFDGHTWWANSKALEAAGISRQSRDPAGGKFVRDPQTGELTGAIKEDAADAVIRRAIPQPQRNQVLEALREGMRAANRVGLVGAISPDGVHVEGGDFSFLDAYDELRRQGLLTVRFYIAARLEPGTFSTAQIRKLENARQRFHDEWLSAGAAKFFLDGVIESHTAAMLAPYSDEPAETGKLLWNADEYKRAVSEFDRHNIQVFTHAIGDRAVRLALDAYDLARQTNRTQDARHRIEHIETVTGEDIPRFGSLGVVASFQPLHAYPGDDITKLWIPHVGSERAQRGWAWRSIETNGAVLAFGSDWPIVTLNPWPGVQNALTRQTTAGEPVGGFVPKERITLADTIKAYTLGAAFAGRREKTEGSLEVGKLADLIVLSQDLFRIEPSEIAKAEVLLTMVDGKVVYESPNWTAPASKSAAKTATTDGAK